ncbi:MAG TPA: MFS transporter [Candidatus Limnocylindrales bacterium]|nr:MFS transporter [Candidatus Limnocylindrales bacterium]
MTGTTADRTNAVTTVSARNPFSGRDFRLLWLGEAVSAVGDQFALIALPWLALVLTGSALALGGAMALMAIPRAVLMTFGGVAVDRFSPRRVMLGSNAVRLVAVAVLGAAVVAGSAELWMLYAFALVFGVADAFFFPAQTAIVPELVTDEQLQRANGIVQGTAQVTVLVGPVAAGIVIAALGGTAGQASIAGIGAALLVDAATFVVSLATLLLIEPRAHVAGSHDSVIESIKEGARFIWASKGMRAMILVSLAANFLIVGPFEVGMPFIAYSRLPEGAAAFGLVTAAFGGGSLVGLLFGSILPPPRPSRFGAVVILPMALAGIAMAGLSAAHSTIVAAALTGVAGIALGYTNLLSITWIQRRIPAALMGRVMSLLITGSVGLVPVSMFLAGFAVQVNVDLTMLGAGVGMAIVAVLAVASRAVRNIGLEPFAEEPASALDVGAAEASAAAGAAEASASASPAA